MSFFRNLFVALLPATLLAAPDGFATAQASGTQHPDTAAISVREPKEPSSLNRALGEARRKVWPLTEQEAKHPGNEGVHFFASAPSQGFTMRFRDGAVTLASEEWRGTLRLADVNGQPCLERRAPAANGARVDYEHPGGIREWFDNSPSGVKHGLVLTSRPAGAAYAGRLELRFAMEGLNVRAEAEAGPDALEWVNPATGQPALRYRGITVNDAAGTAVAAQMQPAEGGFVLTVSDDDAVYPLTIDPLITSASQKLWPTLTGDGGEQDGFGRALALDGDTLLAGVPGDDSASESGSGSVYVFNRRGDEWIFQSKLLPEVTKQYSGFGNGLALRGDTAVVAAPWADNPGASRSGNVTVFVRSNGVWQPQARLQLNGAATDDQFGAALALHNDTLAVGAPMDDTAAGQDAGSVSVFVRAAGQWSLSRQLFGPQPLAGERFGTGLAISADWLVAGAPGYDLPGYDRAGCAVVFKAGPTGWELQKRLQAGAPERFEAMGNALAISGARIVAGTDGKLFSFYSHRAFVFEAAGGGSWHETELPAASGADLSVSRQSVAIAGDTIAIGYPSGNLPGNRETGTVEVFVRGATGWARQAVLSNGPSSPIGDEFGYTVVLQGDTLVAGSPSKNTDGGDYAGTAHIYTRAASQWTMRQTLSSGDGGWHEYFGMSVAVKGDTAVIGAGWDHSAATYFGGSVYVFTRSGEEWSLQTKLLPADLRRMDNFGSAVAMTANDIVIGAPEGEPLGTASTSSGVGAVYIFSRNGNAWTQTGKVFGDIDAHLGDFGRSVAISGNTIVAGAPDDQNSGHEGEAYVFVRTGTVWNRQSRLPVDEAMGGSWAGTAVALDGNTAVVGAPFPNSGYARVYFRTGSTWTLQAALEPSDGGTYDHFGQSVAISGDTLLIGSPSHSDWDNFIFSLGAVYTYTREGGTWTPGEKLMLPEDIRRGHDEFGTAVTMSGNRAVIGAIRERVQFTSGKGEAYLYEKTDAGWTRLATLKPFDGIIAASFGSAVAIDGDTVLVGARQADSTDPAFGEPRTDHGNVYTFRVIEADDALTAYYQWLSPLVAPSPPSAAPHGDGVANLLKYSFNMSSSGPDRRELTPDTGTSGLPSVRLVSTPAGLRIRVEFLRRAGAGLFYTPVKTAAPATGPWTALTVQPEITNIDPVWDRVVYDDPLDPLAAHRLFYQIKVSFQP